MATKHRHSRSGIYRVRQVSTGRCYIGQTIDVDIRLPTHKWMLQNNRHHSINLQRAWNAGSPDDFAFEVVGYCDESLLNDIEQYLLDDVRSSSFNVARYVDSPHRGRPLSLAHKTKIGAANRGRVTSIAARIKQSEARKG